MTEFAMPHGDLLVAPEAQDWVEKLLTQISAPSFADKFTRKVNVESEEGANQQGDFWTEYAGTWRGTLRPYTVKDGTLYVRVSGMLLKDFPYQMGGWATGYEYIEEAVKRGVDDTEVEQIVLLVNSPGGVVSGCFDCSDSIYEARGTKPIKAVADEFAYSAAYAIASAADEIIVARTGGVGSVGVMREHMEISRALEAHGRTVTLIYAGDQKTDGHPAIPLSPEAKARMQERADALYQIFVSTVARNRDMDEQAVRDTEAATFMAPQAVETGLADAVGSLGSLSANADPSNDNDEDEEMSNDNSAVDQAALDAAVAKATADGTAAGELAGATAERTRISAIMDSDEAKARPAAARHVALNSDMTAEAAASFLVGLPEEAKTPSNDGAASGGNGFENAMNGSENPNLGAGDEANENGEASVSDKIFASAGY